MNEEKANKLLDEVPAKIVLQEMLNMVAEGKMNLADPVVAKAVQDALQILDEVEDDERI